MSHERAASTGAADRLKGAKESVCSSHRTSGSVATERALRATSAQTPASFLSDDLIRAKAYELWERGGSLHGGDQDDWFRAQGMLSRDSADAEVPKTATSDEEPSIAAKMIADGVQSVAALATSAAQAVEVLFGLRGDHKKSD